MSSPPGYPVAGSPPSTTYPLPNPRKRPSISTNISSSKRRKPSFAGSSAPSSAHPLRQTSFPPELAGSDDTHGSRQASFSPSVISHGRGSSIVGGGKGRRSKAGSTRDGKTGGSLRGGKKGANAAEGQAAIEDDENGADDDDDDGDAIDAIMEGSESAGGQMSEQAKRLEREHMLMLLNAFSKEQFERYEIWRRVRLKKETVRKIVNQTLSQSVPASVVTTVMTSTKIFIGELVESARGVQEEWAAASIKLPSGEANPRLANGEGQSQGTNGRAGQETKDENAEDLSHSNEKQDWHIKESDKGPLLPIHLREALRRYRKDREGGSVGFQGLSLHGVEATASRTGGKRLFR